MESDIKQTSSQAFDGQQDVNRPLWLCASLAVQIEIRNINIYNEIPKK